MVKSRCLAGMRSANWSAVKSDPKSRFFRDQYVDAEGLALAMFNDPVQLGCQRLGREAATSQHAETARTADGRHHVAAMAEGEKRKFRADHLLDVRNHLSAIASFCPAMFCIHRATSSNIGFAVFSTPDYKSADDRYPPAPRFRGSWRWIWPGCATSSPRHWPEHWAARICHRNTATHPHRPRRHAGRHSAARAVPFIMTDAQFFFRSAYFCRACFAACA